MKFDKDYLDFLSSFRIGPTEVEELKPFIFKLINYIDMARHDGLLGHVEWAIMEEKDPLYERYLRPVCDGVDKKELDYALYTAFGLLDLSRVEKFRHYIAWLSGCCMSDGSSGYSTRRKFALVTGLTWEEISEGSHAINTLETKENLSKSEEVDTTSQIKIEPQKKLHFKDLCKASKLEMIYILAHLKDEQIACALTGTSNSFKVKVLSITTRDRDGRIREHIGQYSKFYDHEKIKRARKIIVYRLRHLGKYGV